MAEPVAISVQGTPNPNAAKFTLNRTVAAQGRTYRDPVAADAAWAAQLLAIDGVTQVFALNNFVSVTKRSEVAWDVIGPQIESVLQQAFA